MLYIWMNLSKLRMNNMIDKNDTGKKLICITDTREIRISNVDTRRE